MDTRLRQIGLSCTTDKWSDTEFVCQLSCISLFSGNSQASPMIWPLIRPSLSKRLFDCSKQPNYLPILFTGAFRASAGIQGGHQGAPGLGGGRSEYLPTTWHEKAMGQSVGRRGGEGKGGRIERRKREKWKIILRISRRKRRRGVKN